MKIFLHLNCQCYYLAKNFGFLLLFLQMKGTLLGGENMVQSWWQILEWEQERKRKSINWWWLSCFAFFYFLQTSPLRFCYCTKKLTLSLFIMRNWKEGYHWLNVLKGFCQWLSSNIYIMQLLGKLKAAFSLSGYFWSEICDSLVNSGKIKFLKLSYDTHF